MWCDFMPLPCACVRACVRVCVCVCVCVGAFMYASIDCYVNVAIAVGEVRTMLLGHDLLLPSGF